MNKQQKDQKEGNAPVTGGKTIDGAHESEATRKPIGHNTQRDGGVGEAPLKPEGPSNDFRPDPSQDRNNQPNNS